MSEAPNMPERIWMGSLVNGGEGKSYVRDDIHHADVHAAVKRAIEACAEVNDGQAQEILDNQAPASAVNALRWSAKAVRAIASDPEAIAKIIRGGE